MAEQIEIIIENEGKSGISNYEPLKQWALEQVSAYKGLVVQEDDLQTAKADCAKLRKVAKNASDLRISVEKEHKQKIAKTLEQLKEITSIFNDAAADIDAQVKAFDEKRKQEKQEAIGNIYESNIGDMRELLPMTKLYNEKWMNKGYTLSDIEKEIKDKVKSVKENIGTIQMLGTKYESQMISAYLERFEMGDALKKKTELERIDEEMERRRKAAEEEAIRKQEEAKAAAESEETVNTAEQSEPIVEESKQEQQYRLAFEVYGNKEELTALCNFIRDNGYRYKRLP